MRAPTFAYWKGMIQPRRSDGLFDFADILPTALARGRPWGEACRPISQDDLHRWRRPSFVPGRRRRPFSSQKPVPTP